MATECKVQGNTKLLDKFIQRCQRISEDFFSEIAQEILKISSSRHLTEVYYSRKISYCCIETGNVVCKSRSDFFKVKQNL